MMKKFFACAAAAGVSLLPAFSQQYIADYSVAKEGVLRSIPQEYVDKARNELVIAYQHTSHGTHVSRGIYGLQDYKPGDEALFAVSLSEEAGKLEFRDFDLSGYAPPDVNGSDLSADETAFIQTTRNYLDAAQNAAVNVVMWSWCDIAGHDVSGNYLPGMESLVSEYGPGGTKIGTGAGQRVNPVTFIFMTGHANENANTGEGNPKDQAALITDHCNTHGRFCLDYYSIDSHDMDDNYYEDVGDNGNSAAYGGNFYLDWQDSHQLGADYFENKVSPGGAVDFGVHNTQHITANRKGFAMWWILARIAGWEEGPEDIPVTSIRVTVSGGANEVFTGEKLQIHTEVLPSNASNRSIIWSVMNQTGSATITEGGLLTAVSAGSVEVVAAAQDASGVTGSLQISILDAEVPVSSIHIYPENGTDCIERGGTLQFHAEVLPEDASNPHPFWSVINDEGEAAISSGGLLTATGGGKVRVVGRAQDGSGVADTTGITITEPVMIESIEVRAAGGKPQVPVGGTLQCRVDYTPENASLKEVVWWVHQMTGEANITQDGLLIALSEGKVGVVAVTCDCSGLRDTLVVDIFPPVMIDSIAISSASGKLEVNQGEFLQLIAHILPEEASNKGLTWTVQNKTGEADLYMDGLLKGIREGEVEVTAESQDGSGVKSTAVVAITGQATGVHEVRSRELILSPNPGRGLFYLYAGDVSIGLIELLDAGGHLLRQVKPEPAHSVILLDLQGLPAGCYFLRATSDLGILTKKLILTNH